MTSCGTVSFFVAMSCRTIKMTFNQIEQGTGLFQRDEVAAVDLLVTRACNACSQIAAMRGRHQTILLHADHQGLGPDFG